MKLFRVDALVLMSESPMVRDFIAGHNYLPDPILGGGLFGQTTALGRAPLIVDIGHPAIRLYEQYFKNNPNLGRSITTLQQFDDLRDLGSAARRRWCRGDVAVWPVYACWV